MVTTDCFNVQCRIPGDWLPVRVAEIQEHMFGIFFFFWGGECESGKMCACLTQSLDVQNTFVLVVQCVSKILVQFRSLLFQKVTMV